LTFQKKKMEVNKYKSIGPTPFIILPAYNESGALEILIPKIDSVLKENYVIVLVDDGSTDLTSKTVEVFSDRFPVKYIKHERNMGLGKAVQTGLTYALNSASDSDIIVTMDADNTQDPVLIKQMKDSISRYDVVIASRFTEGGREIGVPLLRKIFSRVAGLLFKILFPCRVRDYTCGFRMYRAGILKKYFDRMREFPATESGFAVMTEILVKLVLFGAEPGEIPLVLRYDRKKGKSKIKICSTVFSYLKMAIAIKLKARTIRNKGLKRIFHIVNIPWFSGLAAYAVDMVNFAAGDNFRFTFGAVKNSVLFNKLQTENIVVPLPGRGSFASIRGAVKALPEIKKADKVIAHTGSSLFIAVLSSFFKEKKILRVRAEQGNINKNIFNKVIHKKVKKVIVPTEAIKDDYTAFGLPEQKIFMLSPVVDTDVFPFSDIPEGLSIGIVGRLDRVKGHRVLIKAFAEVLKILPEAGLFIAGAEEGVKWKELHSFAEELGVRDSVIYKGRLDEKDIAGFMKSCRLGVISSTGSEAVSRAALEWMSCGRPVVASDVGCLSEFVIDGETGFIVPPDNFRILAEKITDILKNTGLNAKMGRNAGKKVREKHSPEVYSKKLAEIYK